MRLPIVIAALSALAAGPAAAQTFHPYKPKAYETTPHKPSSVYAPKPAEAHKPRAAASEAPAFKPWRPSSATSVFGPDKPKRAH